MVPAERNQFGHAESMTIRQLDHGRIAMPMPPQVSGRAYQGLYLRWGEVFTAPPVGIRTFPWGWDTSGREAVARQRRLQGGRCTLSLRGFHENFPKKGGGWDAPTPHHH